MYETFYGLREAPFDLTVNPRFVLLTEKHREALANLTFGVVRRKGVTVIIGEAGTGKTTLIHRAMPEIENQLDGQSVSWAYLKNPILSSSEFLAFIAERFGLSAAAAHSKTRLMDELERTLIAGRRAALIIDEAQSATLELLEETRLLANIETSETKLLPLILLGQPELADRLNQPELRQLKQRVTLRYRLEPLTLHECAQYIVNRVRQAGGDPTSVFTRTAVIKIHERSRGIPRIISVLCDNALMSGYAAGQRPVNAQIVETVCADFDLAASEPTDTSRPLHFLARSYS